MAKSVRQQLSDLVSQKKPNVFFKGLNTDTDITYIGNDQYTDAMNVRLDSKDSDLGTIQNLKSNLLEETLGFSAFVFKHLSPNPKKFWSNATPVPSNASLDKVRFTFVKNDNSNITFSDGNDYAEVDLSYDNINNLTSITYQSDSNDYNENDIIQACYEILVQTKKYTDVLHISLEIEGITKSLKFIPVDSSIVAKNTDSVLLTSFLSGVATVITPTFDTYDSDGIGADGIKLYPLGFVSFSDYIAAVCYIDSTLQTVVKIYTNADGSVSNVQPVIFTNFGIASKTARISLEKIEENENFNRIYWTDGVNPVKTVNLEASPSYYKDYTSASSFNLFSKSPLTPPVITSVRDGGNIKCGSWSYLYNLVTKDGKKSLFSPITSPLPLPKITLNDDYHNVVGGNIGESSSKSVTIEVNVTDPKYTKVELYGLHYTDGDGGAVMYKLKEESIEGETTAVLTHTGSEGAADIVTTEEVLSKKNTWDVAQDLAVKDNRLFAGNLKNLSEELESNINAFRVKSYKPSTAPSSFDTAYTGDVTTTVGYENADIYNEVLYTTTHTDTTLYRYAEPGVVDGQSKRLLFGASTPGFFETGDVNGVHITFHLKKFDLDDYDYFFKTIDENPSQTNDGRCSPPFCGIYGGGPSGREFNNYKSPLFSNDFVGYMRDEVYRFGIQFYDKSGNTTFTYPIGDVRMPSIESDYRAIGDDNFVFAAGGQHGTNKHVLIDSNGDGYVLHPHFKIKLKQSLIDKISGFEIVRAERTDTDKRVIAAGILNQTLIYADDANNDLLKNCIGADKLNLFTQRNAHTLVTVYNFYDADVSPIYTLDTPESIFGSLNYTSSGSHDLKICSMLKNKSYEIDEIGNKDSNLTVITHGNNHSNIDFISDSSSSSTYYAAPVEITRTIDPDLDHLNRFSFFTKYFCDDTANSNLTDATKIAHQSKTIHYGKNIVPDELVPASLLNTSQNYKHSAGIYSTDNTNFNKIDVNNNLIENADLELVSVNRSILLNIDQQQYFTFSSSNLFDGEPTIKGENYYARKPYAKIINPLTIDSGQYGGNTTTAFINQRWISTGAYRSVTDIRDSNNNISSDINHINVFGGDTYINMFSLNKFHKSNLKADDDFAIVQGLIFPVESSINLDLRSGTFFGESSPRLQFEDDYTYEQSYSAQNSVKSFPSKDPNIAQVQNLSNVIAASNIKVAGDVIDAFSTFDSNEIFEVDRNYGQIKNILTFKDTMYCLQENGTSFLSINSRALITAQDGSSIAIQSAVGTGNVIERNDYISTKYGSQQISNALSTDTGLYWIDNSRASICAVLDQSPKQVINLNEKLNCNSLLTALKTKKIKDNPLNISTTTGEEGGITISYEPYINEILFNVSYYDSGMQYVTTAYNDVLGLFISKRSYSPILSTTHKGYLYTVGNEHSDTVADTDDKRRQIYSHNSRATTFNTFYGTQANDPYVEFVNNEEISALKVFDKLSINNKEIVANGIFSKFAFSTDIDTVETLDLASNDIDKVVAGKQLVPIFVTKRMKGTHIRIKIEQSTNQTSQSFNLRSAITHYRKNIL